ncbi:MAG: ornithine carbamoyltransferase [Gammaproteobacteria bacterium]|nr:ornithine carbamoyltransferase [Gammaproteobacteria bacterium]
MLSIAKAQSAPLSEFPQHFLSVADLSREQVLEVFALAAELKQKAAPLLAGKQAALLFEKPSLRTRVSFEAGLSRLGGHAIYLDHQAQRLGAREAVKDYAKNLERWVDVLVARVFSHKTLAELAAHSRIPVVNALSDQEHPCQALADFFTLAEQGLDLGSLKLAYVGDGNNVCQSLVLLAAIFGCQMTVVTPWGYEPDADLMLKAGDIAKASGAVIKLGHDTAMLAGHDAVYTDTWASMGQESEHDDRVRLFSALQVNEKLMQGQGLKYFMHCLPAHRGEEVTDAVIDGPGSLVYEQAENRMHVQNALLALLLG